MITADDFGADVAVNEAVEIAHTQGILTAASLMVAGAAVELLISACARRSENEEISGAVFFAQDITQRKVLELANTIRP